MASTPAVSVVIPVYNAAPCIGELYRRLIAVLEATTTSFEIVLVDDASSDDSWQRVRDLAMADSRLQAIQLARNFGQHAAIAAGLSAARGDSVIVMDCDLQDQPEEIPKLQAAAKEDVEIVFARRKNRSDPRHRQWSSRAALNLVALLSGANIDPEIGTFSLIKRRVVDEYLRVVDKHSHYLQVLRWLGFNQQTVDVIEAERFAGTSSYTFSKLVRHFWNGMVSQSERLLHAAVYIGFIFCGLAVVQMIVLVARSLMHRIGVPGWASLMATIWFVGGTIVFSLGIIGLYIGKIHEQVQRRPPFIVRSHVSTGVAKTDAAEAGSVHRW